MKKQDIILTQPRAVIGDAAMKLFRIGQTDPPSRKDGEKLIHMHVYYECLMTSRDGVHWDRSVKDAWLSGGVEDDREWTQRNFITVGGIIVRDDEFYFYVEKHYMWEDGGIWAYSVPKYRLMSLYAIGAEM